MSKVKKDTLIHLAILEQDRDKLLNKLEQTNGEIRRILKQLPENHPKRKLQRI